MKWKPNWTIERMLNNKFGHQFVKTKCVFSENSPKTLKFICNLLNLLINLVFIIKHCEFPKYCMIIVKGSWENNTIYSNIQFFISVNWQILFQPNEFM